MADIAMCQHVDCEKSKECYRFMAKQGLWQNYTDFKQICRSPTYLWFYPMCDVVNKNE